MPVRALFPSFLLALILLVGVNTAAASAATQAPKAKIAVGAKKKAAKKAKAKKAAKAKAKKAGKARRASAPVAAPAPAPAAPEVCAHTDLLPDAGNLDLIRAALVCLHNQVRAQSGLGALTENGALAAAGAAHSADMVRGGYFDHTTPAGVDFADRILAAGYAGRGDAWTVGENLAWGSGELSTPAALMRAWMNSPGHRENVLKGGYREFGFGLHLGTPSGSAAGVTVSVEFGARLS